MRLLQLGSMPKKRLFDHEEREAGEAWMYVDPATGLVYALTDDARDSLDPLWREVPEGR